MVCIYCCIARPTSACRRLSGCLPNTGRYHTTVWRPRTAHRREQYIVPFTAATIGEFFMRRGAMCWSFLTTSQARVATGSFVAAGNGRRAGGLPGDIFYVQTQLMDAPAEWMPSRRGSMTFWHRGHAAGRLEVHTFQPDFDCDGL